MNLVPNKTATQEEKKNIFLSFIIDPVQNAFI